MSQTYTEHQMEDLHTRYNCECPNIEYFVLNQLRWAGRLVRMEGRIPKQLFYGELVNGKRPRCKPKERYKDCVKYNFKELDIDYNNWEESALYRSEWRKAVKDGCNLLETKRHGRANLKRELRRGCAYNLLSGFARWLCEKCGRVLLSKAGYVNHLKSHENNPQNTLVRPQFGTTTCVICSKVCKSISGLKRHMNIHNDVLLQPDPINPVKTAFVCQLCYNPASQLLVYEFI